MMPPAPVVLLAILMLGYPLVQIAAIALRRRKRLRFRMLMDGMLEDPAYGDAERIALRGLRRETIDNPLILISPFLLPVVAVVDILEVSTKRLRVEDPGDLFLSFAELSKTSALRHDPRLEEASEHGIDLAFASWPITMMLALLITLPFAGSATLIRWIRTKTFEMLSMRRTLAHTVRVTSAISR